MCCFGDSMAERPVGPLGKMWLAGVVFLLGTVVTVCSSSVAAETPENLARGKACVLVPNPGYRYCSDSEDRLQLTDGKLTEGYFWTQKGTVGWASSGFASITVDLGRIEPISGVSLRTAAGAAGVQWPASIRILVSDAGKAYYDVGDLIDLDRRRNGPLSNDSYAVRRLVTHDLATRARFVRFLVFFSGAFGFCDEVEVFRGPDSLLAVAPKGKAMPTDPYRVFVSMRKKLGIQRRFRLDQQGIHDAIEKASLEDAATRQQLLDELAEAGGALDVESVDTPGFRAVLPYSAQHARLFAVQSHLWHALGQPLLAAWPVCPWDPSRLFAAAPALDPSRAIVVHVMRGEFRAVAVNLAGTQKGKATVQCHFEGLPGGETPSYVQMHQVPWTDTQQGQPVAAALPIVSPSEGTWPIDLYPGLSGQLWMTFHVQDTAPGDYRGQLVLKMDQRATVRLPVELHIHPVRFPRKTSLLFGGWSYSNGRGAYGITEKNRAAFLAHLQDHFVNGPWATGGVLSRVEFTTSGQIHLDTRELDAWLDQWPNAKRYHVFASVPNSLGGAAIGTKEFSSHVARWIHAWVQHLKNRGVAANQLALLLRDEPHEGTDVKPIIAWARAIRAAEPDVIIWEDPTYRDPRKAPAELWECCDVLCPNRPMWLQTPSLEPFYRAQQKKGTVLQFYSCSGPARLLDPYSYYRLQAWHCWHIGATGTFFWAFGDNSKTSSWNEYGGARFGFTPMFVDSTSVTAAKQMEALRESVEDYEYCVMLRSAIARAKKRGSASDDVEKAEQLLSSAIAALLQAEGAKSMLWHDPKDRTAADRLRIAILKSLDGLQ